MDHFINRMGTGRGAKALWDGNCGGGANGCINIRDGEDYLTLRSLQMRLNGTGSDRFIYANNNTGIVVEDFDFEGTDGNSFGAIHVEGGTNWQFIDGRLDDMGTPGANGNNGIHLVDGTTYVLISNVDFGQAPHDTLISDGDKVFVTGSTFDNRNNFGGASDTGYRAATFRRAGEARVEKSVFIGGDGSWTSLKWQVEQGQLRWNDIQTKEASTPSTSGSVGGIIQFGPCCNSEQGQTGLTAPKSADWAAYQNDLSDVNGWVARFTTKRIDGDDGSSSPKAYPDGRMDNTTFERNYIADSGQSIDEFEYDIKSSYRNGDDFASNFVSKNIFAQSSANIGVRCLEGGTNCVSGTLASLESDIGTGNTFSGSKACSGTYPQSLANGTGSSSTSVVVDDARLFAYRWTAPASPVPLAAKAQVALADEAKNSTPPNPAPFVSVLVTVELKEPVALINSVAM